MSGCKKLIIAGVVVAIIILAAGVYGIWGSSEVEVVVPGRAYITGWSLSPASDKIAYTAMDSVTRVLILATGQTLSFESCGSVRWYDNAILHCRSNSIILFNDQIHKEKLSRVQASDIDLIEVLQTADNIYRVDKTHDFLFVLNEDVHTNPENSFLITDVADLDEILSKFDHTILYSHRASPEKYGWGEKIYSPNGKYYFVWNNSVITIFDADSDKMVKQYVNKKAYLELGGWDAASSGVYFHPQQPLGIFSLFQIRWPQGINKLRVPG